MTQTSAATSLRFEIKQPIEYTYRESLNSINLTGSRERKKYKERDEWAYVWIKEIDKVEDSDKVVGIS